jgi:hypothetical protein
MKDTVAKIFGLNLPTLVMSKLAALEATNGTLICGAELEIENTPYGDRWYRDNINRGVWQVERDGSLRPQDNSFEFISMPMVLGSLLAEMEAFFNKTKFTMENNYSDRTSVHLHTNVTDYTQEQLATLALTYTVVEDVLFRFVNHYNAPTPDGYSRDTNLYCIPWNQCRMNFGLVNKLFANPGGALKNWQKYTALNLLPVISQGTVEWRHMHGTNDMDKLRKWFDMIGSIMLFAKTADFNDVVKTVYVLNDTSAYQQFFNGVFQGTLPYTEDYQVALAEGVINAKYSLVSWEKLKGKVDPKKATTWDFITANEAAEGAVNAAAQLVDLDIRAAEARLIQAQAIHRFAINTEGFRPVPAPLARARPGLRQQEEEAARARWTRDHEAWVRRMEDGDTEAQQVEEAEDE